MVVGKSVDLAIMRTRVQFLGVGVNFVLFIYPHMGHKYCCSSKEAESRNISIIFELLCSQCQINILNSLPIQSQILTTLYNKPCGNIAQKGENANNQHFLLFQQCFLPFSKQILIFEYNLSCCL